MDGDGHREQGIQVGEFPGHIGSRFYRRARLRESRKLELTVRRVLFLPVLIANSVCTLLSQDLSPDVLKIARAITVNREL